MARQSASGMNEEKLMVDLMFPLMRMGGREGGRGGWGGLLPVEGGGLAREALQVLLPGRGLQGLHISPVGGANDVKEGLQLRLGGAVHWASLSTKYLPAW